MTLKYISICAGIEAASVAWHSLGFQPLAFSEIEPFPSAVLAHHYPDVPNLGDMTKYLDWPEDLLAECDLLVGGCPCQAFSVAGLRNSLGDERGNLTIVYVHLIDHIDSIRKKHGKPPIIAVYENVPGILSTKDNALGCLVGAICGQDAAIETETGKWPTTGVLWGEKRRVGYRILDAQYFGVAQRRRRIFLVAVPNQLVEHFGDGACPSEILSIPESLRGDTPPSRETGQSFTHSSAPCLTSIGRGVERTGDSTRRPYLVGGIDYENNAHGNEEDTAATLNCNHEQPIVFGINEKPEVGHCLRSGASKADKHESTTYVLQHEHLVAHTLRGEGFDASEDGTGRGTPLVPVAYGIPGNWIGRKPENGGNAVEPMVEVSPCQTKTDMHAVYTNFKVRRLTPVECARLQGFPDTYLDITFRNKPAADSNKYKALGNSMAVPVMAWIGRRIKSVFDVDIEDLI